MNETFNSQPGFSGDGEPLAEVPTLGQSFQHHLQSDLSKPILITGLLREKIKTWFPLLSEVSSMYLWSKFSDPSWNPNDYTKFENDDIELWFIISSCGMLYPLSDMIDSEYVDVQSWKAVDEAFRNADEDDDDVNFGEDPMVLNEITSESSQNEVDPMKVHEALAYFKRQCCKRQKNCPKYHYLLGIGKLTLAEQTYEGIHIYVEPDYNEEQVDVVSYNDKLYEQYADQELSTPQQKAIILMYLKNLEDTVNESLQVPFPLGKREIIHP